MEEFLFYLKNSIVFGLKLLKAWCSVTDTFCDIATAKFKIQFQNYPFRNAYFQNLINGY